MFRVLKKLRDWEMRTMTKSTCHICGFESYEDEHSFHTCSTVMQGTIDKQAIEINMQRIEINKLRDVINNHTPGRYYFK